MVRRGLHISEYGVLDDETGETTRCATEEEVYERLGLPWIPPELREGRGELEAAAEGQAAGADHGRATCAATCTATRRSRDGRNTLEEMVEAARALGYEYLAVTDHSASHGFGNHVTPEALEARIDEIAALNERLDGFTVLAGTESNILTDGSLDYPDELLQRLDWVIGSIHTSFGMDEDAMTERMIAAIEHPWVDAIGHPTGRKIETRPAVLDRHDAGDRGRGGERDDDRDQLGAGPARHEREPRPRGGRGGRDDPDRLRRARRGDADQRPLRDRDRPSRLADGASRSRTRGRGRTSRRCASGRRS